mgnify:FL=1
MPTMKCLEHNHASELERSFDDTIFNDDFTNCDVAGEMTLLDTFEVGGPAGMKLTTSTTQF